MGAAGGPGLSRGRVPGAPVHGPCPRPAWPSLHFLSWLPGQARLPKPSLKRNQAAVARLFLDNCVENPQSTCSIMHFFFFRKEKGEGVSGSPTMGKALHGPLRGEVVARALQLPSPGSKNSGDRLTWASASAFRGCRAHNHPTSQLGGLRPCCPCPHPSKHSLMEVQSAHRKLHIFKVYNLICFDRCRHP